MLNDCVVNVTQTHESDGPNLNPLARRGGERK